MFSTGEANCPVQFLKKLIQALNPGEEALFQRSKRKFCAKDKIWFDRAPLGVNSLGNMMKEISIAANLSQVYTNHCIRATSVTLLDRAGVPVHRIMQVSGHRNEGSVKVYCERQTLQQQKQYYERCSSSWFEMIAELIVCLTIESHRCGSRRFDRYTAGLHQAMVSTECVTV